MAKQKRLSDDERRANLRNCQENYRHRIRRFTFQFSLKDIEVRQWFEAQPDKGKYLKALIMADKEREMLRLRQKQAMTLVSRSVSEFLTEFPQATLNLMTPDGYVLLNTEIMKEAKKDGMVYSHLGSSDAHCAAELSAILSQRIHSINPKDDTSDYYYMITEYPEGGE